MEQKYALEAFVTLAEESLYDSAEGWNPPAYDVRLDADTDRDGNRDYRIRVTPGGATGGIDRDDWLRVLEVAGEYGASVDLQNSGIELR